MPRGGTCPGRRLGMVRTLIIVAVVIVVIFLILRFVF
jgi:hypothetical protein